MVMAHLVLMLLVLNPKPLFVLEGQLIPRTLEKITLQVTFLSFTYVHIVVGKVTLRIFFILKKVLGSLCLGFPWFLNPPHDVSHLFGLGNHFQRHEILDKLILVCLHMILILPYHKDDLVRTFVIRQFFWFHDIYV